MMSGLQREEKRSVSQDDGSSPKKSRTDSFSQNDLTQVDELPPVENCSICFEEGTLINAIIPHGCTKCNLDSWSVCQSCNDTLLSRKCPMCRSEYAPLVFHQMPGKISILYSIY